MKIIFSLLMILGLLVGCGNEETNVTTGVVNPTNLSVHSMFKFDDTEEVGEGFLELFKLPDGVDGLKIIEEAYLDKNYVSFKKSYESARKLNLSGSEYKYFMTNSFINSINRSMQEHNLTPERVTINYSVTTVYDRVKSGNYFIKFGGKSGNKFVTCFKSLKIGENEIKVDLADDVLFILETANLDSTTEGILNTCIMDMQFYDISKDYN